MLAVSFGAFIALFLLAVISWRNAERRAQAVKDLAEAQRQVEEKRAEVNNLAQTAASQRQAMARERLETRRKFYLSDVRLAYRSWQNGEPAAAIRLLSPYGPKEFDDLRGFEWRYLWRLCQRRDSLFTLLCDKKAVSAVAFSPDGKVLALAPAAYNADYWCRRWLSRGRTETDDGNLSSARGAGRHPEHATRPRRGERVCRAPAHLGSRRPRWRCGRWGAVRRQQ